MVWLGGGNWRDIAEDDERSTYQLAGALVLLNALAAWLVAVVAVTSMSEVHPTLAVLITLVLGLLVGVFGRVLASSLAARSRFAPGDIVKGMVAVLIGVVIGELAVLAVFTGPVNRELDNQVDAARAAVMNGALAGELEQRRTDRSQLDEKIDAAIARRDSARAVARCEVSPAPGCPDEQITGDPGRADEAQQAERALADAERDLAAARADRERNAPALDAEIASTTGLLAGDVARATDLARADVGIDARWRAMHTYTTENDVAMVLRLGIVAFFVMLNLLPLLLRIWRGQTGHDLRVQARRSRLRADVAAETAIAVKRAEVRMTEVGEADSLERLERLALPAPERARSDDDAAEESPRNLPAVVESGDLEPVSSHLARRESGPLDALPGPLPNLARAVTGVMRPFIPERLSNLPANPVRTARTLLEDVEEFTFSLTRRRKVTVESDEPDPGDVPETKATLRRSAVASRILDSADERRDVPTQGLAHAEARRTLPLGQQLPELPRGDTRELPAGEPKDSSGVT